MMGISPFKSGQPWLPAQGQFNRTAAKQAIQPASVLFSGLKKYQNRVEQHFPVVVVGGGAAGLTAMYDLVKRNGIKAVLFESEKRLGGNSKSEKSPDGMPHPAGASIFIPGDGEAKKLWRELEIPLDEKYRLKPEIYVMDGERFTSFGSKADREEFAPKTPEKKEAAKGFRKLLRKLKRLAHSKTLGPKVPIYDAHGKAVDKWDSIPMSKFMERYSDDVKLMAEPYIKSDLAASSDEVSAYIGMIDLEDLNNPRYMLPGGNGFIIEKMASAITEAAGPEHKALQPENVVEKMVQDKHKVYLKIRDADNKSHIVSADSVLMAAPYNVVPRIFEDLPRKVINLMKAIPKSSYSIINIFFNTTPLKTQQFYMLPRSKHISDLVVTSPFGREDRQPTPDAPSVMSIYTAHTGRLKNEKAFLKEIVDDIKGHFPEITDRIITGIKQVPFKFAMAAPSPGQVKQLRNMDRTFGRITMINSDGGGVPSLLTAVDEALRGAKVAKDQIPQEENTEPAAS